jgi:hypothetical protein
MAIEVRTLVIKAVVQQDQGSGGAGGAAASSSGHNDSKPDEEILNKCLDKITEILKERHER